MKNIIKEVIIVIIVMIILMGALILLDKSVRRNNMETAKMNVDWNTYTCSLYWE